MTVISFLLALESVNRFTFEAKSNFPGVRNTVELLISGNPWHLKNCSFRVGIPLWEAQKVVSDMAP